VNATPCRRPPQRHVRRAATCTACGPTHFNKKFVPNFSRVTFEKKAPPGDERASGQRGGK
jgi:hypothetical protein